MHRIAPSDDIFHPYGADWRSVVDDEVHTAYGATYYVLRLVPGCIFLICTDIILERAVDRSVGRVSLLVRRVPSGDGSFVGICLDSLFDADDDIHTAYEVSGWPSTFFHFYIFQSCIDTNPGIEDGASAT